MFQYATGRALSLLFETELRVDTSFLNEDTAGNYTKRKYELDGFTMPVQSIATGDLEVFMKTHNGGIHRIINKLFPGRLVKHFFVEKGHQFHPQIFNCSSEVYISGFWQCEKYFLDYADTIRKDFTIKPEFISGINDLLNQVSGLNSVSLHVRRGDYVTNPNANAFHGLCSPEYYKLAVKKIAQQNKNIEIFVFSDDIAWCKENMKFEFPLHFVDTGNLFKDLLLMQYCKHNIVANSSFSWWGAWLNPHPDKMVIAPANWFRDAKINSSDIIPETWTKIAL